MWRQYLYTDGGIYEGEWLDGKMHGRGLYTFPNGNKYDGEWQDDVKDGYGVLQCAPAVPRPLLSPRALQLHTTYYRLQTLPTAPEPESPPLLAASTPAGPSACATLCPTRPAHQRPSSTSRYVNGERYEGYWKEDKADGKGTLTYIHGDKYVGDWVAAKKERQKRKIH